MYIQKLQITKLKASEIEALLKSKEEYKIATRLVCMLQIAKGGSSRAAEELLLLSHNQICIWVKRLNKEGVKGLYDKPKAGRKMRITNEQLALLKHTVLYKEPNEFGFNTATWTAPLLVKWLEKECNLTYSDDAVYLLLKNKLGLTHKKGNGFYPEANKEKRSEFIATYKKNLKKKRVMQ